MMSWTSGCSQRRAGQAGRLATVSIVLVAFSSVTAQVRAADEFVAVTDEMLQNPDPADWLNWRRTLDGWGFRCRVHVTSCEIVIYGCSV